MQRSRVPDRIVESIPDPQVIREQLSDALRSAKLLRSLLKLAEQVRKSQSMGKGAGHGK